MSFLSIQKKNHSFSREQHTTETCHSNVVNKQRERFHTHPAQIPHSLIHLPVGVCQTGGKEAKFPFIIKGTWLELRRVTCKSKSIKAYYYIYYYYYTISYLLKPVLYHYFSLKEFHTHPSRMQIELAHQNCDFRAKNFPPCPKFCETEMRPARKRNCDQLNVFWW